MTIAQSHQAGDEALNHLSTNRGAGGDLVRAFPGIQNTESQAWLDEWFQTRIEKRYSGSLSESDAVLPFESLPFQVDDAPLAANIRIKSLQAHFFRGFREGLGLVDLADDFIVIDGRNSSGKTSLAEALEWLFSGKLCRRENKYGGNPRELKDCVSNQFRPDDVETWVRATFTLEPGQQDSKEFTLLRVLREDYGKTANATCESVLYLNDEELNAAKEMQVLDQLFAGVPPLLLQHTLRDFVQSDPRRRREYFERLLRLDELTELIRQAVVTDERATEFVSPNGGTNLRRWNEMGSMIQDDLSKRAHSRILQSNEDDVTGHLSTTLASIARIEFPELLEGLTESETILPVLREEQVKIRQTSFPILAQLRPRRQLSDEQGIMDYSVAVESLGQRVRGAWNDYEPTLRQVETIGSGNIAVANAYKILVEAGLVHDDKDLQSCPLCAFEGVDTLSATRVATIHSWDPIRENERSGRQSLESVTTSLLDEIKKIILEFSELLPGASADIDWDSALNEVSHHIAVTAGNLRTVIAEQPDLVSHASSGRLLVAEGIPQLTTQKQCESFIGRCLDIATGLSGLPTVARRYREAFASVEAAVSSEASTDPSYRLRDCLIDCIKTSVAISMDLQWERAKQLAQKDLQEIRNSLMTYRQTFLESRREQFNGEVNSVWTALRNERYSSFSQLHIPQPSGRGFLIEIELKASLDDSHAQVEVDALRVFSESQVNALGIAAFVARAKLLGHRLLIFDDPVQSMDEEHFKTFARDVIPQLLNEGFQVILLTHNDTFARDVSYYHYDRDSYVTMSIRHSRRDGSVVTEGNRRVAERLRIAELRMEEGKLDEAWTYVRLAIERLYLVTYAKYGPVDFSAESWQQQTADYMWTQGAGEVFQEKMPNSEDRLRLKDILGMTAAGAHDSPPRGETDVRDSVAFLRQALSTLRVGG